MQQKGPWSCCAPKGRDKNNPFLFPLWRSLFLHFLIFFPFFALLSNAFHHSSCMQFVFMVWVSLSHPLPAAEHLHKGEKMTKPAQGLKGEVPSASFVVGLEVDGSLLFCINIDRGDGFAACCYFCVDSSFLYFFSFFGSEILLISRSALEMKHNFGG